MAPAKQRFFLRLPDVDLAISRVALRVSQGGHHIPEEVIIRRFHRGWDNFHRYYKDLVDSWKIVIAGNQDHHLSLKPAINAGAQAIQVGKGAGIDQAAGFGVFRNARISPGAGLRSRLTFSDNPIGEPPSIRFCHSGL